METLLRDLRFAVRTTLRRPLFAAVAVLSLALGIGANSAIFSMVNGILFQPLPGIEEPDELVRIYAVRRGFEFPIGLSYQEMLDLAEGSGELVGELMGHTPISFGVAASGSVPEVAWGLASAGDYFGVLGTRPFAGRFFGAGEEESADPVAVASYDFWQRRFGGDPAAIGKPLSIDGESFVLVGVAPPGFIGTEAIFAPDLWLPARSYLAAKDQAEAMNDRAARTWKVAARLRPGVSVAELDAFVEAAGTTLAEEYSETNRDIAFAAMPDSEARIEAGLGDAMNTIVAILMTLVGLVLVIACANVANLMLARSSARRRELSLRVALGAGRGRLLRQLLTESVLMALAGGGIGILIALATARWLEGIRLPTSIPLRLEVTPDASVFLYTLLVSVAAGLAFGLAPAWKASRRHPASGLRDAPMNESGSRRPSLTSGLVVAQVALSLVLLVAAGLFLRSLDRALQVDVGMDMAGVAAVSVDLGMLDRDEEEGRHFYREMRRRLGEAPGFAEVATASPVPLDWSAGGAVFGLGRDLGSGVGDELLVLTSTVGPEYFGAMKTEILEGRGFEPTDDRDAEPVVVVNRAFAERVWPGEAALGRTLRIGGRSGDPLTVIGVAETGKYRLLAEGPRPYAFLPFEQRYRARGTFLVRSTLPASEVIARMRAEIRDLEPDLAVTEAQELEALVGGRTLMPIRLMALLAGAFGLVGLVLASIGLYGVMTFSVARRTREIGVRMALGARTTQVLGQILGHGLKLTAVGVVLGTLASFAATRVLGRFLVGVSGSDPGTFTAVIIGLVTVAGLAALAPALRAARVDPVRTLRAE